MKTWPIVLAVVLVGVAIVLAIVLTRPRPAGDIEPGLYSGVSSEWCVEHDGTFLPNIPEYGGPGIGGCAIP